MQLEEGAFAGSGKPGDMSHFTASISSSDCVWPLVLQVLVPTPKPSHICFPLSQSPFFLEFLQNPARQPSLRSPQTRRANHPFLYHLSPFTSAIYSCIAWSLLPSIWSSPRIGRQCRTLFISDPRAQYKAWHTGVQQMLVGSN